MTLYEKYLHFPDGDILEISHFLSINQIVDIHGKPIEMPISTNRILAYSVCRQKTTEEKGLVVTNYYLYQLSAYELLEYL